MRPANCRLVAAGAALLLTAARAFAQGGAAAPPADGRLVALVADGRVFVYPTRPPVDGEGWIIFRDGSPLTAEPMRGARDAAAFGAMVGPDLPLLERITEGASLSEVYLRLRRGGTAAGMAQILSPRAAFALGALYVDSMVSPGATHSYTARLVRLARPDSVLRTARATVRVVEMPVPAPPPPRGRAQDGVISLEWSPARFTGASEDIVVAYVVERADSGGSFQRLSALPVMRLAEQPSAFRDEAVVSRQLYRYRLRAADLLGRLSDPSPEVAVRAPDGRGPVPPSRVGAQATDGQIRVVWTVSPEPEVRGFHVERAVGGDSVFVRVTRVPVPADAPEWTDTLVRGREIYTYRVRALDNAGRAGLPSNPTTTRGLDEQPPPAPAGLTVTPLSGHRVRLVWQPVPDRDLRGYDVLRAEPGDTGFARLTAQALRTAVYVDSGYGATSLVPGRTYAWRIVAIDSSGNVSAPVHAELQIVDDEAPEQARSIGLRNHLGRYVEILWTGSPSHDVARYLVERVDAGGAPQVVASVPNHADFIARDTTVRRGGAAMWRVIAVDSAGNRSAPQADTLTFRDVTRPPAPRRATAVRAADGVTIRWERVVTADLRGYVIYRAERTDGPRTRVAEVPTTAREFVDRGAPPGMRYVVRAVDTSGNESAESPVAIPGEAR